MASNSINIPVSRRLEGKVALITGGASGIGASTARLFQQHGAKVVIADVQDDLGHALCQELHPDVTYAHCDVTNEDDVRNTVDHVVAAHGKLDIMYNNAGISGSMSPSIIEMEKANFEKVMSINVVGSFLGAKHAARVMVPARKGTILFTSSVTSVICMAAAPAYTASKHAIVGLAKSLGVELGQFGIRVNCISPAILATPLTSKSMGWEAEQTEDVMGRAGNLKGVVLQSEDIAQAALFWLPLAIKTVAGMMLGKPAYVKDWELVLQNLMLELAESKEGDVVMKCLQLSYDDLPPQLRSCLLCFSIFPEEYEISKRKLIYWWIGEGFAKENMGKTAEKIAEDYFMEMVSRCLILKEGIKSHNEKVVSCRIHDLVRDLVIRIAREEAFMRFDDECTDGNSRRSSIGSTNMNSFEAKRKLRSLVAPTDPKLSENHHLLGTTLCEFRLLRVLDLGKFYVGSWDCIGHLLHLVYLSLNGNEQVVELPNSIGKLTNLQILDLHGCNQLKGLPSHITRLENLTHLNVHNCHNLKYFPKGMGKLIKLQVLRGFKFDTSSSTRFCKITELKSMTRLHRLTIYIDSIRETKIDDFGELSQLQFLRSLELVAPCDCDSDDSETKRMIEELRPPHQVEKLKLRGNYGEWLPSWLQPFALPSLRTLSIHSQGGQTMSESFLSCETGFWRLKVLLLFNVKIEEDWWRTSRAMPHLKYLQVPSVVKHFPCDQRGVWKKASKPGRKEEITEETISGLS